MLAQTYTDFELIISDNGSTDATEEICRHYASVDARIRYVRNESNRGLSWNFNRVFELAEGEYFKWLSHDDVCDPRLLERCIQALDTCPSAVVCCARLAFLDERAAAVMPYEVERDLTDPSPHKRFHRLLLDTSWAYQIHGLIRSSMLRGTPLIANYSSSDFALLARLALMGPFIGIPEYLSYQRLHAAQSTQLDRYRRAEWFKPGCDGRLSFPQWQLFFAYLQGVQATSLPLNERLWCYFHLLCWPAWERNWRKLGKDILVALPPLTGAVARRARGGTIWQRPDPIADQARSPVQEIAQPPGGGVEAALEGIVTGRLPSRDHQPLPMEGVD
jgi:glycosyltransferase involved in cell wall biosynthesis